MSYDEEFGHPVDTGGEYARPDLLNGHLVIVFSIAYRDSVSDGIQTRFGPKDAIVCDVVDLDDKDDNGQPGKLFRLTNFMQGKLIQGLRPFIGRKVLGRIGTQVSKSGLNPAWIITDMSMEPVAMERAKAWQAANPNFTPSEYVPRAEWEQRQAYLRPAQPQQELATPLLTQEEAYALQRRLAQQPEPPMRPMSPSPSIPTAPAAVPVAGSYVPTTDELNMLQQLRMEKARREAEQSKFQQDEAPF